MQVVLLDIDTTKLQIRCRDTEFEDTTNPGTPGPWSAWSAASAGTLTPDTAQQLLNLAVMASLTDPEDPSENPSIIVSFHVANPDGSPIRTVDSEYRLAPAS